ncbi:MAG: NADPH:quinone reductase [Aliidongia sp.]|nr:NADPH:quinone reductase [Aliidongia sp.]
MKALLSKTPGGPETLVLAEMPAPQPEPGEVVLHVKACGVNFPDVLIIQDLYQFKPPRPFAPGSEVAGIVTAIGAGVTQFKNGDRVFAMTGSGGMSEQLAVSATRCILMPDAMPFDEAASFILTYGTSHHALKDRAQLRPGETLLVLGAAGGVGLAAIELGKAAGARVIAAVSSAEKLEFAKAHGADDGVIYPRGPFDKAGAKALAELFKQACGPNGADVVYDAVGGDYAEAALRAIAWEGRFLVVGFPAGIPKIPLNLPLLKACQIIGVFWGAFSQRDPDRNRANNEELLAFYARGAIKPQISERFPLARGAEAIARLANREALGKIVVMME